MYNRYIRAEDGSYTRVSEEEPRRAPPRQDASPHVPPPENSRTPPPPGEPPCSGTGGSDGIAGYLRRILDQLHLDHIDTGDLLLLGLLYFLFREKADEELLIALGLLLIL